MQNRRVDPVRLELHDKTRKAIAARLRGVCAHLTDEQFAALVERMATIEVKYSARRQETFFATHNER